MIPWSRKEFKKIKDFLEFNENKVTTYPSLWDTRNAFLRGKLIALSASKKKLKRACNSSLTTHLKALEKKEANSYLIYEIPRQMDGPGGHHLE
jgi:RNase P protein component